MSETNMGSYRDPLDDAVDPAFLSELRRYGVVLIDLLHWCESAPRTWRELAAHSPVWAGIAGEFTDARGDYALADALLAVCESPDGRRIRRIVEAERRGDRPRVRALIAACEWQHWARKEWWCERCERYCLRRRLGMAARRTMARAEGKR